jgi:predicted glycoside hydrolase/deacetylase ChbG (UPF0249 family)
MTRLVLCADDFALSDGVSRAIVTLAAAGRISATGAMTNRPHWRAWSREIAGHAARIDIGVHLNLTAGEPIAPMPRLCPSGSLPALSVVMRAALLSGDVRAEIRAETARQIDAFEQAMGRRPDFIDGHQHVHAMPGVRRPVIEELVRRVTLKRPEGDHARPHVPYVRDPSDSIAAIRARGVAVRKALVISGLAAGFGRVVRAAGLATNQGFSGVSTFDPARDFAADMRRFLLMPGQSHLVMCHPGHVDDTLRRLDPVVDSRESEFLVLSEGRWLEGHQLVRFADL